MKSPALQQSIGFGDRGGWWVVVQSILMAAVVGVGVIWGGQWTMDWLWGLGWGLFGIGGVVGVLGVWQLGAARTPFPRPLAEAPLVTRGVYGWVRHPLYCSVLLASTGWGLIWASGGALVLTAAMAVFFDAKARHEERWLRARHPEYAAYAARVRRLIPWIY